MNTRATTVLDGPWRFRPDPEDRGRAGRWFDDDGESGSLTAGGDSLPDGAALWCFHRFDAAGAFAPAADNRVSLPGIAGRVDAWLNGEPLGRDSAGGEPMTFVIPSPPREGICTLALRLEKPIPEAAAFLHASVQLESLPAERIEHVFVQPDIRRRRLTISLLTNAPGTVRLRLVETGGETGGETRVDSQGGDPVTALLEFPEFEYWSPESPVQYTLTAEFGRGDSHLDAVSTPFGMREITIKERRFALNNRPYPLRGASFSVDAPGLSDPAVLAKVKAAGFNLLRVRGDVLPARLLQQCDELGLLVWLEPSSAGELPARIRPLRNHPSLVIVTLPADSAGIQPMRSDDPSRLLFLPPSPDRTQEARFIRPYHDEAEACDYLEMQAPGPVERAVELHYQHNGAPDRLVLFGAAGLRGLPGGDAAAETAFHERSLEPVFGSPQRFQEALVDAQANALRVQLDAMRTNAKSAAYCLDLPASFLQEPDAGPLRQTLRLAQVPLRLIIECDRTNISPREEVRVKVSLVNDRRVEGRADLSVQVVGPTQQVLWKKRRAVRITKAGAELWSGNLAASGSAGEHRIVARLMQGMNRVAEASIPLIVTPAALPVPIAVMLPPGVAGAPLIRKYIQFAEERAPVYILPPIANTVRAYPAEFVSEMLGEVAAGAVGIVLSPPADWSELGNAAETDGLAISPRSLPGGRAGVYHYAKRHPVFEELPARGLLGVAYRNVLPHTAFSGETELDIAGCLDAHALDADVLDTAEHGGEAAHHWLSDILVKRYGEGRLVFTHFRLLEHLEHDPVAARLFTNLVTHFASRAVPADDAPIPDRSILKWLKQEQTRVRRWMVLGMFPNFGEAGHDTAYPPESVVDLGAVYPGWYNAIGWKRWYSTAADEHILDLAAATAPGGAACTQDDYGTAYAYAEFNHPHRDPVFAYFPERNATKCWLNGRLMHEARGNPDADPRHPARADAVFRQGKNTLLLKVSKTPGPLVASVDFEAKDGRPLDLRWWR